MSFQPVRTYLYAKWCFKAGSSMACSWGWTLCAEILPGSLPTACIDSRAPCLPAGHGAVRRAGDRPGLVLPSEQDPALKEVINQAVNKAFWNLCSKISVQGRRGGWDQGKVRAAVYLPWRMMVQQPCHHAALPGPWGQIRSPGGLGSRFMMCCVYAQTW